MYQVADNLWIQRDRSLETVPGSRLMANNAGNGGVLATGGLRIGELFPFNDQTELLAISSAELFYQDSTGTWQVQKGPANGQAFVGNGNLGHVAHAEWRGHVFLTPDGGASPQKVYRDNTNTLQLRQAGLPAPSIFPPLTSAQQFGACVQLATSLRTSMLTHFGDVGAGHAHLGRSRSRTLTRSPLRRRSRSSSHTSRRSGRNLRLTLPTRKNLSAWPRA